MKNIIRKLFLIPVYLYKYCISPFTPPSCRYTPSCSSYFIESVMRFGIIKGTISGCARLIRCRGRYFGGPDPVPDEWSFNSIRNEFKARKKPKGFDKQVRPN